ncbi:Nickel and cobalt resistance protein CnrA [subsurface metagenome]
MDIELAAGTPVADTDLAVMSMQKMVLDRPEVLTTYSIAGASGGFSASAAEKKENIAQLYIALREGSRGAEEKELMEELRSRFRDIPGVEYDFSRPVLFTFKAPVEVQIKGFNLDVLEDMAQRVSGQLAATPGITDIRSSIEGGNPEIWIEFDRRRMAALGLDVETVANLIRKKVQGEVATEFSARDRKIDVRVRLRKEDRSSLSDLTGLTVSTSSGVSIPLSSVAGIKIERGPGAIHRLDHERVAFVRANLTGTDLGSTVRSIESAVGELPLPVDYSITIGGQRQEMILSFAGLRLALLLAVLLVYLVMAAQFESLLQPLIVMVTIPFGLVGVILILFLTGVSVSVVVLIGVIMMAGIVVNNAIVLVDCINRLKAKGLARTEAILEAGKIRLRPILMTTSTTVLGLLPMALGFGEGAEIRAPMAITVIGGLIISTLLTLVLIPTVYAVLDRRG